MDGHDKDLYRAPDEEMVSRDNMSEDEIELRELLNDFSKNPENKETLLRLSEVLLARQLYDEAWLYLDRYVNLVDDDPMAFNYAGFIRFSQGRFEEAESFLNKALSLDGNHPNALYNSAMLYLEKGNFIQAKNLFERLALIEDDNPEIFNNLGAILYQEGNLDAAEERFLKALAIDPEDIAALENIIEIFLETNRRAEAETYFLKLKALNPPEEEIQEMERLLTQSKPEPTWAPSADFSYENTMEKHGLRIGIVTDWAPGERGELGYWVRKSLNTHGHETHVFARTGRLPHCKDNDRICPPMKMGKWAVPNLHLSENPNTDEEEFKGWLKSCAPDAIIFIDEPNTNLVKIIQNSSILTMACPAFVGADKTTPESLTIHDGVLAVTPWIYEAMKDNLSPDKLIPSDLGIDLQEFSPMEKDREDTVFLFDCGYGSVEDLEHLVTLLTAFSLLNHEAAARSKLLIRTASDWSLMPDAIRNRVEGNPQMDVISGNINNAWFLKMGDVLIHTRLSPGIHLMAPQASASGIPSIILDKSPATGWIYDQHMILKVPRAPAPGSEKGEIPRTADPKTLADTMASLATDPEVLDYMANLCREKSQQILDTCERSRVFCDKVITFIASNKPGVKEAQPVHAAAGGPVKEPGQNQTPEGLLNAIENAIASGKTENARELMAQYRRHIE